MLQVPGCKLQVSKNLYNLMLVTWDLFMDIIVTHGNADFDALASLVAAKKLYPKAKIVLPAMQERSVRDFISLIRGGVKFELEKDIDFRNMKRLIVVDTCCRRRIGKAADYLTNPDLKIHCYDHHPARDADLAAEKKIYGKTGATVTLLVEIIKKRRIALTPFEATVLALGIYEDTGSLTFPTTTRKDIDAVGFLFAQGANLRLISSYLNRALTEAEMRLLSAMIEATRTYTVNGIQIAVVCVSAGDDSSDLAWVTHKLIEIENFNVVFALVQTAARRVQLIARSRLEAVDVAKIARFFNGGGHASAASAIIKDRSLFDVNKQLIALLRKTVKSEICAQEIMNFPVMTLSPLQKVAEARKVIEEFNVTVMPVVEEGRVIGVISRNDLARAVRNGYSHAPIKGYMKRNVIIGSLKTPLTELQKAMIENNIGRVLIMNRGRLQGIVSRSDIFKHTHKDISLAPGRKRTGRKEGISLRTKNLRSKMNAVLPEKIRALLKTSGAIADELKISAYAVGGFVRDIILGRENFDVDIVVEANAINYAQVLGRGLGAQMKSHQRFKTAKLMLPDGLHIDIAMARTESYAHPAALPVVESSSLSEDLYRRDFTINTLAMGLNKDNFGVLIDCFGAEKDIREKRIRVLHDLSFVEDPTRILRAVRFEQRLDFVIDKHTENLIRAAVDLEMFDRLQKFRIGDELMLLLNEPHPVKVIRRMAQLHELRFIHPKIRLNKAMLGMLESVDDVLGWYKLTFSGVALRQWIVYLLVIIDTLSAAECTEIFRHFGFKKAVKDCIMLVKGRGARIIGVLRKMDAPAASKVYTLLKPLPAEAVLFLMAKTDQMKVKEMIMQFLLHFSGVCLSISGHDLNKIYPKPGPYFKRVLEKTLCAKIDGMISSKEEELEYAKKALAGFVKSFKGEKEI
ncbi:MAG: CBS domain-containing protein [Candidatus Omnitrophica bacterium]|nr:CBS domain-containing protein [Candidatus Omnitrophota bacterium]